MCSQTVNLHTIECAIQAKLETCLNVTRGENLVVLGAYEINQLTTDSTIADTVTVLNVSADVGNYSTKPNQVICRAVEIKVITALKVPDPNTDKRRREVMALVLDGVVKELSLQKLALNIEPLKPVHSENISSELNNEGRILVFQTVFKTMHTVIDECEPEIPEVDLLELNMHHELSYVNENGDAVITPVMNSSLHTNRDKQRYAFVADSSTLR